MPQHPDAVKFFLWIAEAQGAKLAVRDTDAP